MRNYRDMTDEEIATLKELYPVTTNRELSQRFGISVDAILDRFAKPLGWQKDLRVLRIGNRGGVSLTDEQVRWIVKHYKHTKNRDILKRFGIGESTLYRIARKHGLKKSKQFLRKTQHENSMLGYAVCEEYGVYDKNAEYAREQWRQRKERGETLGFKKGESNKDRMSARKFKQLMERIHDKRRETIRKERMRINWGLEQKTNLKLVHNRERAVYRHQLKRRGYLVERGSRIIYYTSDTRRSPITEANAQQYGLSIKLLTLSQ